MYSELIRTYNVSLIDLILTPPSLILLCVAPFVVLSALGPACTYWGRHLDVSCGRANCWHPIGQTSSVSPSCCCYRSNLIRTGGGGDALPGILAHPNPYAQGEGGPAYSARHANAAHTCRFGESQTFARACAPLSPRLLQPKCSVSARGAPACKSQILPPSGPKSQLPRFRRRPWRPFRSLRARRAWAPVAPTALELTSMANTRRCLDSARPLASACVPETRGRGGGGRGVRGGGSVRFRTLDPADWAGGGRRGGGGQKCRKMTPPPFWGRKS